MGEKIIDQKVVKREDKGSAGYLGKKYRGLKDALGAMCMAPVLIVIAVGLLFYSEGFHKSSEIIGQLELKQASEVVNMTGLYKAQGMVNVDSPALAPEVGGVLYYTYVVEEYREVEETEQETQIVVEDGREIEETVETTKLVEK